MKSQRQLQFGETVKRIIADIFLRGEVISFSGGYITVIEADASPDMKNVRIFIDIFGGEKNQDEIVKKLNLLAPQFRYHLAKKLVARGVPEISFILDKTSANAMKIESLIESEIEKTTTKPKKK